MSNSKEIDINALYSIVLHETENENIQEIDTNIYASISNLIGKLKKEEYDNIEAKIKNTLIEMITELTKLLLKTRLEKARDSNLLDFNNLLDEEKYILEGEEEMRDRTDMILNATLNGKSKLLESISQKHKSKSIVVRFLKEVNQIVGADLEKYGPFKSEDVAIIPYENAQALIAKKLVTKIQIDN
jgi:DNA replication factor GINS